jgi:anti-sigma factor RsiW
MSECRELEPFLAAYVDGEVPTDLSGRVHAHLAACAYCRRVVACEQAVRDALRTRRAGLVTVAPARLRRRCAACACGSASGAGWRRWQSRRMLIPLSAAAALLLTLGVTSVVLLNGTVDALVTQLTLDHVKCFQFAPSHGVVDAAVAGDSWRSAYGWLIHVPRSAAAEQLELLDVRRCRSTQGISAHMMYRWHGEPLSVYVLDSLPSSDIRVERVVSRLGREAVIWSDAGRTYAVVGRGAPADLEHIAHYVRASAR